MAKAKSAGAPGGNSSKIKRSISTSLLAVLLPITVVGIVAIILFITGQAKSSILNMTELDLKAETEANAYNIGTAFKMLTAKYGQYADTLENVEFKDKAAIAKYIEPSTEYNAVPNSGIYIAYDDGDYVFSNGTVMPDDYDPRTRDWYAFGMENDTFAQTLPYMDQATGMLCTSYERRIDFHDGTKGVMGVDVYLKTVQEQANSFKPLETGSSFIVDADGSLISYIDEEKIGTMLSETDPTLYKLYEEGIEGVRINKGSDGHKYYVAASAVQGTNWILISSVAEADILAEVNHFQTISYIIMVLMIIVIAIVILVGVNKIVAVPVKALANKIGHVSDGDFTIELSPGKGDEIGLIRDQLREYIEKMRVLINTIITTSERLTTESESSKEAASAMTEQCRNQSASMEQIKEVMEGMSNAVTELANNATELAGAVSDLTQKGSDANETMLQLVEQADAGQKDMGAVQNNMGSISKSMDEMNEVVVTVGESAEKITGIVEMIDSIAMQTNLLSLNASIEAARAGEAGKGFAVVAGEIAKLATDSSESAGKIAEIIEDITAQIKTLSEKSQANVNAIGASTEAVTTAGETFEKIFSDLSATGKIMKEMISMMSNVDGIASSVAAISEQQSASSQEVSSTVEQLAESAEEVANKSQGVDDGAGVVSKAAEDIAEAVKIFKI
ncbi:MAG: methyl-accepting chemotaxis protein [Lachnospiraceae bacterium]|nr:methyl-accepting chemotaxis protein [Lachnospiraceae bacterium]